MAADRRNDPHDTHAAPLRQRDDTDVANDDRDLDRFGRAADADDQEAARELGSTPAAGLGGDPADREAVQRTGPGTHGGRPLNENGDTRGTDKVYGQHDSAEGTSPPHGEREASDQDVRENMRGGALHDYDAAGPVKDQKR
ncbi:hypothetical protein [Coralloluteibacterium stylophorae]|uniref:Uncharacterized protein n=1 Tax=Coralloluteibacterium stylophorae TaxID=1776034 RepID=A0A8J8AXU8_9GAMM|nr:hypothetical protein [Coralloluteibacterium stylophorae]MBS7455625.1 hypothetical protein [Coralloluteibacterium stylophorae]